MAFDPSRLKTQLLNTGLSVKDQPQYQLLNSMIDFISSLTASVTNITNSSTTNTIINNNVVNQFSNLLDDSFAFDEGILGSPYANLSSAHTGLGVSGQVAFWTSPTNQSGDNGLFWDNTNKRLGIGQSTPLQILHIKATSPSIQLEKTGILNWFAGNVTGNNYTIYPDSATNVVFNIDSTGRVGIGFTDPGTYGYTLGVHALTNGNFGVRTLVGIGGTGTGVGLDSQLDASSGVSKMGFRASEFQFLTGNVGIFTVPSSPVHIQHDNGATIAAGQGDQIRIDSGTSGHISTLHLTDNVTSDAFIDFIPSATASSRYISLTCRTTLGDLAIFGSGGVSIGNTTDPGAAGNVFIGKSGVQPIVSLLSSDFGSAGLTGAVVDIQANTNTTGAPGVLSLRDKNNVQRRVFTDSNSVLRVNGTPTVTAGDLVGTIVGFQTEKNDITITYDGATKSNDQNPGSGNVIRISNNGTNTGAGILTGLTGGTAGRVMIIFNDDSQSLRINFEDAGSTAANRFYSPAGSGPITIVSGQSRMVYYSGDASRWSALD